MLDMKPHLHVRGRKEGTMSWEEVWNDHKKESIFRDEPGDKDPFPFRGGGGP